MLMIFDCADGEVVYSRRTEEVYSISGFDVNSSNFYRFFLCSEASCVCGEMTFNISVMSFTVSTSKMTGSSMTRKAIDAQLLNDNLFVTTTTGDIAVYSLSEKAFKGCLRLETGSACYITSIRGDRVAISSGTNIVVVIDTNDAQSLNVVKRITCRTEDRILMLLTNKKGDVFASFDSGLFELIDSSSFETSVLPIQLSPCPPVTCILSGDYLICGSQKGQLHIWSVETLMISRHLYCDSRQLSVTCLVRSSEGDIICGFQDGGIKILNRDSGAMKLVIPQAHRGAVTCVCASENFFVSGGMDGIIRIWRGGITITEFSTPAASIGGVVVETENVIAFTNKRELMQFSIQKKKLLKKLSALSLAGNIVGMTSSLFQGQDSVVVTAHHEGRCIVWDFDYDHPLKIFVVAEGLTCIGSFGVNTVLLGSAKGGLATLCIDSDPSVPVSIEANPISSKAIVCIAADCETGKKVLLNSEGLMLIVN
jgi:WD40 repeat protein